MDVDCGIEDAARSRRHHALLPPRYLLLGLAGRNCSVSLYDPSYFGINAHLHHHFCDDNDDNGLDDGSSNDDGLEG